MLTITLNWQKKKQGICTHAVVGLTIHTYLHTLFIPESKLYAQLKAKNYTKGKTLLQKEVKRLSCMKTPLKRTNYVSDTQQSGKLKVLFKLTQLLP